MRSTPAGSPRTKKSNTSRHGVHLARLIVRGRKELGLSQAELARRTRWSRPYINLLESGQRGADVTALVELAAVLELDPLELLHAAYRDRLARAGVPARDPKEHSSLALNHFGARQLQKKQLPFSVAVLRIVGNAHEDGTLVLERRFEDCRPSAVERPVFEIVLAEQVVGGAAEPYGGDALEVLRKPADLAIEVEGTAAGQTARHRIRFPGGWSRRESAADDTVSFLYRRALRHAYARSPEEYAKSHRGVDPGAAFVGRGITYLKYLVDRLEITRTLPADDWAESWKFRVWWGRDIETRYDLDPRGTCRSFALRTTSVSATVTIEQPLAGYSYAIEWQPASVAARFGTEGGPG